MVKLESIYHFAALWCVLGAASDLCLLWAFARTEPHGRSRRLAGRARYDRWEVLGLLAFSILAWPAVLWIARQKLRR